MPGKNDSLIVNRLTNNASGDDVTLPPATQGSVLMLAMNQKINRLTKTRDLLVERLQHNPPSPQQIANALPGIDAEILLCAKVVSLIDAGTAIEFPSDQQMTELADAVRTLGKKTAEGAATGELITALGKAIDTFPA